jgi:butyrate kinase
MIEKDILVIYPETILTQIALYKGKTLLFLKNIKHKQKDLDKYAELTDQLEFRTNVILNELKDNDADLNQVEIIVGRGGLLKPVNAGVYEVNEKMVHDLKTGVEGIHHTNLGGLIAYEIARKIDAKPILADPVSVDEMDDIARVSGHSLIERKSIFHSLNQKFFARKYAKAQHKDYEQLNLIMRLAYSNKYTEDEILQILTKEGGYASYLGTGDLNEINTLMENGDEKALFISDACAYQVSKEIGAMYAVLEGEVDAIILTGNIFHSERFLENVKKRVGKVADFALYPSVNDIEALAENAFLVMRGELEVQEYK